MSKCVKSERGTGEEREKGAREERERNRRRVEGLYSVVGNLHMIRCAHGIALASSLCEVCPH